MFKSSFSIQKTKVWKNQSFQVYKICKMNSKNKDRIFSNFIRTVLQVICIEYDIIKNQSIVVDRTIFWNYSSMEYKKRISLSFIAYES